VNILEIGKLIAGLKLLWEKISKDKLYLVQLIGAAVLVIVNYAVGPFLADEVVLGIGAALVVPDVLWKLIVNLGKKVAEFVRERRE